MKSPRCLSLMFACLLICAGFNAFAADRPNIILFITDDMTWFDAGCYGSPDVKTPNLDKLATQGMKFNRCYTSTAMCAPTRQQLYTGLWPVRSGAYPNHSAVKKGTRSLGHHFAELGYRVAIAGKKHYKPAASYPFEALPGGDKTQRNGRIQVEDFDLKAVREFITRDSDQPYFLICATNQPHAPWTRGDASAYEPDKLTLPLYLVDTPVTREELTKYYAEITYADKLLGGVMDELNAARQAENTIMLFTSEQGSQLPFAKWTCYEAGLKTGLVVRWPGKIKPGTATDAMVQYVDIVPTLIEASGGDPAAIDTGRGGAPDGGRGFDGTSFLSVLLRKKDQHRDVVFGIHTTRGIIMGSNFPIRSVREGRYKLILNLNHEEAFSNLVIKAKHSPIWASWVQAAEAGNAKAAELVHRYAYRPAVELYDLKDDPHEMTNLAEHPEMAPIIASLKAKLDAWMQQQGDKGMETEMLAKPG